MTKTSRPWKRIGLQLGILAGVGLALVGGVEPSLAAPVCVEEDQCTFNKPLFLIALDYSTAMNAAFDADTTRWERAVEAVQWIVESDNGYTQGNVLLALMRFGHDPDVDQPGTTIAGDASGLVDGQKLDVSWYDELAPNKDYFHCNGQAVLSALAAMPPPLDGAPAGIGAWTAGALTRANSLFAAAVADHPQEVGPDARKQALIVITQGVWSDPENTQVLLPPAADPVPVAQDMWNNLAIPTYVMSVGDAAGKVHADALAAAGGTGQALVELQSFIDALKLLVQKIINDIEPPSCHPAMPRIMFLLDGSSSMLNVMNDSVQGAMGETRWDLLRSGAIADALSQGTEPLYAGTIDIERWALVGAAVFGGDAAAEQKLVVDYAPCRHLALPWALDPATSCEAPGCDDPWGGPPISWTFQTDEVMNPGPTTTVHSHVPRCDVDPQKPGACAGSGAFVHLGLELVRDNIAAYKTICAQPDAVQTCDAGTRFYNVLVMDGIYDSDEAAVEASLTQMFGEGTRTYVVGLGELAEQPAAVEQLTMMAAWGSGGELDFFAADSQVELQAALGGIFAHMYAEVIGETMIDPCCWSLPACGGLDGGEVGEPDPLPQPETETEGETEATTEATTNAGSDTSGGPATSTTATTGEPTTGATSPDPSWGPTTVTPTSGPTSSPTTDGPTGGVPGESTTGDDAPTGTDSDGGAPGGDTAQEGCACTADTGASGLPAALLGLGLVGLGRRRRSR